MLNRVLLFVVEGFGIGAMPDAADYGDADARTLARLADSTDGLNLPTLENLGLGHLTDVKGIRVVAQPTGCFGRLGFRSKELDSLFAHWELAGCVADGEGSEFGEGFHPRLIGEVEEVVGRKVLGGTIESLSGAWSRHGVEHLSSGAPIIWSDGRRTCHIAAHERAMRAEELFQRSRELRRALKEAWGIWRIVAHALTGEVTAVVGRAGRRDFAVEPPNQTMLDVLNRASQILTGVGKVGDLFSGRGLTRSVPSWSWESTMDEVQGMLNKVPRGLVYSHLDLFDQPSSESAGALMAFDRRLSQLLEQLRAGDLLILTGDHGRDAAKSHGRPTREYVPLLMTGPKLAQGVNLGTRATGTDVAQTIVEALQGEPLAMGDSMLDALQAG